MGNLEEPLDQIRMFLDCERNTEKNPDKHSESPEPRCKATVLNTADP